MKRIGKSSEGILSVNQGFFSQNEKYLTESKKHAALYRLQPTRLQCKLCTAMLPEAPSFVKQTVPYVFCSQCGHLNGMHEDTDEFCKALYLDSTYAEYYSSSDRQAYEKRLEAVYMPKVEFLGDALSELGVDLRKLSHMDLGAGSGYYVGALAKAGCPNVCGFEVSPAQVEFANNMLPQPLVKMIQLDETFSAIEQSNSEVISMIGVLEHLRNPREVLQTIRKNHHIKFVFLVLPLFSFCVFLEMAFPHVYSRHLVSDHTHLFTRQSIDWMMNEFKLALCSEWCFGSDMLDLYRAIGCTLEGNPDTEKMTSPWSNVMKQVMDDLQIELDRKNLSSEVHLLLKVCR